MRTVIVGVMRQWAGLIVVAGCAFSAESHGGGLSMSPEQATWWKTANFLLLAAALGYLVVRFGGRYFRSRTEQIEREIAEAQRMRQEAAARAAALEQRLANIQVEIDRLRQQAMQEMAAEEQRLRQQTEEAIARMERAAEQEIEGMVQQARKRLRVEAAELALRLARQKLEQRLDTTTQRHLLQSFVEDLARRRIKV